jgi:hypothetical protein
MSSDLEFAVFFACVSRADDGNARFKMSRRVEGLVWVEPIHRFFFTSASKRSGQLRR